MGRPVPAGETALRKSTIEKYLQLGYVPIGLRGGLGSAVVAAATELGVTHDTLSKQILRGFLKPNWDLFSGKAVTPGERLKNQQGDNPAYDLTHPVPEGLRLKGTSIRYGKDGEVDQYWNKTGMAGADPEDATELPDPKTITRVSTLYDQQRKITQQWVTTSPAERDKATLWAEFAEGLKSELPRVAPTAGPNFTDDSLATMIPVGDHHLGMLSWKPETGSNYDIRISEDLLARAIDHLIQVTPPCSTALIATMGDFQHYDSFDAVTPTSKNLLDADGRFPKMVRASLRSLRYMIQAALQRHKTVHVIIEIGNHDLSSSIFLMECLAIIYEDEPRVVIDTSPQHYHYWEFGQNLIGTHHGHGAKLADLPRIMSEDRPEAWGRTKHRYIHTGHVHHDSTKSVGTTLVESHGVLAPTDAWAAQKGYRSIRSMKAIVYHREYGEVARHTIRPEMCL